MKQFLLFFSLCFFVGHAFAEEQNAPPAQKKSASQFIGIKVPAEMDSGKAQVSEVLVYQGQWVRSGDVLVKLKDGKEESDVILQSNGVVMKVLLGRGDKVSKGAVLLYLKRIDEKRPDFLSAWEAFYDVNMGVPEVGKKIGGTVKYNIEIPELKDGKWKNACSIRMSYVLNKTGFPVKPEGYAVAKGADGMQYMYRLNDMISFLHETLGAPDIVIDRAPRPENFREMKGILAVTGDGRGDSTGHITLWNGLRCSDICHLTGDPWNRTFTPRKAALWLLP
ncbi:MAG: hypothetical protein LBU76_03160 [Azoarcus sp.]|nr:hypothetical protein [Azoarcus sp.]